MRVQPSYPAGNYWQVVVNNSASCALRYDGAIFCFSYPPEKVLPPPAEADFVNLALTYVYENACALRNNHTVTCWKGMSDAQPLEATPAGTFTSLAGTRQAMCGIRTDGTTTCWGTPGRDPLVPPDGW